MCKDLRLMNDKRKDWESVKEWNIMSPADPADFHRSFGEQIP